MENSARKIIGTLFLQKKINKNNSIITKITRRLILLNYNNNNNNNRYIKRLLLGIVRFY